MIKTNFLGKNKFLFGICAIAICIGLFTPNIEAKEPVLTVQGMEDDQRFPITLLRKAITLGGKYKIEYLDDKRGSVTSEAKLHSDINNGAVDIIWTLTSAKHEKSFQAIYIPVYRGLLGMRIAIVPKDNADVLSNVRNIRDLRQLKAGQGSLWADTQILISNHLPVVKELKYQNLFPMLEGGRFDYFPRGIPEPWAEIEREAKYNLTVDSNVLLRYTAPFYFFVKKGNDKLANHLTEQLNELIRTGEFEQMFFNHSEIKAGLDYANVDKRVVIDLANPNLTASTPLERGELWFDPTNKSE